jgi:hypothetical protein
MKSNKQILWLFIFLCGLVLTSCSQSNPVKSNDAPTQSVVIVETESPTEAIENVVIPTETATEAIVPTAAIEYIEFYYSEFEDFDTWEIFSKNEISSYYQEFTENGLSLKLDNADDYFTAYSNVFGTNTVIEIVFNLLEGEGSLVYQVICRSSNNGEYVFEVNPEGSWEIGNFNFDDQIFESLSAGSSEFFNPGIDINKILIECNQEQLSLTINDNLIDQVRDQSYQEGYAGFGLRLEEEDSALVNIQFFFVSPP